MKTLTLSLTLLFALFPLLSTAAGKHTHGNADLFIAIEGQRVLIELESPAINILGFEYQPNTAAEKAALKQSLAVLQQHHTLITFPKAECQQVSAEAHSPFEDKHRKDKHEHHQEKGHDHDHDHHHKGESDHAEFHTTYTLQCNKPSEIKKAIVTAFTAFAGLETMTVNWLTANKQGSVVSNRKKTEIHF